MNTGAVVVYRSYTVPYRPRLIGTFASGSFTPNGDGRADTWTPQFDLSKPVTGVKLTIRSTKTGSVLRTLTGTGRTAASGTWSSTAATRLGRNWPRAPTAGS